MNVPDLEIEGLEMAALASTAGSRYLELLKRVLTRAALAKPIERHTLRARMPGKRHLLALTQGMVGLLNLELVRLVRTDDTDYIESGHAAENRAEDAESMVGLKQFDQMQAAVSDVIRRRVPGDLIECGVWRGGMSIFMRACLDAFDDASRRLWVADSFEGLPPISGHERSASWWRTGDMAVSLETVRGNFERFGLLDDRVQFLKGFFADTLPRAPIGPIAILRVDADLYTSTRDVLTHLYPRLSPGGYCILDDYANLRDCRRAVDEYRAQHGVQEPIVSIDSRAVYWQRRE